MKTVKAIGPSKKFLPHLGTPCVISYMAYAIRAVARFLCVCVCVGGGGGAVPDPNNFFEPQSGEENCFGLLKFLK